MTYIKLVLIFIIGSFIGGYFVSTQNNGPYMSKEVNFLVLENNVQVDAKGILQLTNSDKPLNLKQFFVLSTVDGLQNKIIMIEGLGNNGAVVFSNPQTLDIVSKNEKQVVAKNDIWTVTIQSDGVYFLDKDGKTGELVSDFLGK